MLLFQNSLYPKEFPRGKVPSGPGDFRPISLTPNFARLVSRILVRRLVQAIGFQDEQRGFIDSDRIAQNTFLLDFKLRYAYEKVKRTFIASIDIRKAFDSIRHEAIFSALRKKNIDIFCIAFIETFYLNFSTNLALYPSHSFKPTCGVRQEEPCHYLNLVMDEVIIEIKKEPIVLDLDGIRLTKAA
ncbi:Retrovirus-related Pol polyprotein type-2 like protein [Argiope bruennichi]|uniref:Retrovirus-related Pol polyprotein type-2 like protein n=1 Tax=Argiope bruennichi TaxID=94029 RepID=A0A8T0EUR0_ARGBR|nr:Retrovirus-related Pol polyprotein type-2 like protein [Argiope bruennichi]